MIVICVPVLRRPHRVALLIESIEAATPEEHRTLFVCSPGDDDEIAAIKDAGAEWIETPEAYMSGDYAKKINLAYRATWEPLLFLGADDLHFHSDWFPNALEKLTENIGVVGTNDLGNKRTRRGEHSTHSLVTREYADRGTIDEPHKILHEGYPHEFVDDELVQTAQKRGAYAHASDCIVEHMHPHWGKSDWDDLYRDEPRRMIEGRKVFEGRRHLWM